MQGRVRYFVMSREESNHWYFCNANEFKIQSSKASLLSSDASKENFPSLFCYPRIVGFFKTNRNMENTRTERQVSRIAKHCPINSLVVMWSKKCFIYLLHKQFLCMRDWKFYFHPHARPKKLVNYIATMSYKSMCYMKTG